MIFKTTFFPYLKKTNNSKYKHTTLIGIGCNVGNCVRRFKKIFLYLKKHPLVDVIQTSVLYKNPPFGYLEQDDFINSVIILKTNLSPKELLYFLLRTEKKFKRKRSFKNAPRTIDLDIILYDNVKINDKKLNLPHPFFKQRDSVLLPMSYLNTKYFSL